MLGTRWVYFIAEAPQVRQSPALQDGCLQTCPSVSWGIHIVFIMLDRKQMCLLPWREILCPPRLFAVQTSLKDSLGLKLM